MHCQTCPGWHRVLGMYRGRSAGFSFPREVTGESMSFDSWDRRSFLRSVGAAGFASTMPEHMFGEKGPVTYEKAQAGPEASAKPKYTIKFAVCGMSHDHIYGMVGAIQRGGGVLTVAYGSEPDKVAGFKKRFPDVRWANSEDEILHDKDIQLVLSSKIASERAPLGVRVMKSGKDFLS